MYINTDKKQSWAKKIFDPLSEKTGARKEKTRKMANFRPKTSKIWQKMLVILIFHT